MTTRRKMRVTRAYIKSCAISSEYAEDAVIEMQAYFRALSKGLAYLKTHFWISTTRTFKTKLEALDYFHKYYFLPSYEEMEMRLAIEGVKI